MSLSMPSIRALSSRYVFSSMAECVAKASTLALRAFNDAALSTRRALTLRVLQATSSALRLLRAMPRSTINERFLHEAAIVGLSDDPRDFPKRAGEIIL